MLLPPAISAIVADISHEARLNALAYGPTGEPVDTAGRRKSDLWQVSVQCHTGIALRRIIEGTGTHGAADYPTYHRLWCLSIHSYPTCPMVTLLPRSIGRGRNVLAEVESPARERAKRTNLDPSTLQY